MIQAAKIHFFRVSIVAALINCSFEWTNSTGMSKLFGFDCQRLWLLYTWTIRHKLFKCSGPPLSNLASFSCIIWKNKLFLRPVQQVSTQLKHYQLAEFTAVYVCETYNKHVPRWNSTITQSCSNLPGNASCGGVLSSILYMKIIMTRQDNLGLGS